MSRSRPERIDASRSTMQSHKNIARIYMLVPSNFDVVTHRASIYHAAMGQGESDVSLRYVYDPEIGFAVRHMNDEFVVPTTIPKKYHEDLANIASAWTGSGVFSLISLRGVTSRDHAQAVCDRILLKAYRENPDHIATKTYIVDDIMIYDRILS